MGSRSSGAYAIVLVTLLVSVLAAPAAVTVATAQTTTGDCDVIADRLSALDAEYDAIRATDAAELAAWTEAREAIAESDMAPFEKLAAFAELDEPYFEGMWARHERKLAILDERATITDQQSACRSDVPAAPPVPEPPVADEDGVIGGGAAPVDDEDAGPLPVAPPQSPGELFAAGFFASFEDAGEDLAELAALLRTLITDPAAFGEHMLQLLETGLDDPMALGPLVGDALVSMVPGGELLRIGASSIQAALANDMYRLGQAVADGSAELALALATVATGGAAYLLVRGAKVLSKFPKLVKLVTALQRTGATATRGARRAARQAESGVRRAVDTVASKARVGRGTPTAVRPRDAGHPSMYHTRGVRPPAGVRVRPTGLPAEWTVKPSKKNAGSLYVDPTNPHNAVRVMPGDANSPHPTSREPYVTWQRNGRPLDRYGRELPDRRSPDAHIPLDEFVFDPTVFR